MSRLPKKNELIRTVDVGGAPMLEVGLVAGSLAETTPIFINRIGIPHLSIPLTPAIARDLADALNAAADVAIERGLYGFDPSESI